MARLTVGEQVVRLSADTRTVGTIELIIPGHMDKYPVRWVDAKAVVAWPSHRLGSLNGCSRSTVALASLARPDEMGTCDQCGRRRRIYQVGTEDYPRQVCGTCQHREDRRVNTKEMWGHGRRGY